MKHIIHKKKNLRKKHHKNLKKHEKTPQRKNGRFHENQMWRRTSALTIKIAAFNAILNKLI